jgi:heat shock protein HtpX
MNALKTTLLLGLLTGLLVVGGDAIAGQNGMIIGFALAVVTNAVSYFFSEKIALMSYSAQPVTPTENAEAYRRVAPIVQGLAHRMSIPMPKLWLIPDQSPNAFATGRSPKHASVAFTAGILQLMNDNEIEGVVAHELGHVLHRDILTSSVAATLAGAITMLASMAKWGMIFGGFGGRDDDRDRNVFAELAMIILAPLAAGLIQMAISRSREYSADAASAKYVGSPYPLINGLQKLDTWSQRIPMDASPSTAHLFIMQPCGMGNLMGRLFSTHPSTADRIARLQQMR